MSCMTEGDGSNSWGTTWRQHQSFSALLVSLVALPEQMVEAPSRIQEEAHVFVFPAAAPRLPFPSRNDGQCYHSSGDVLGRVGAATLPGGDLPDGVLEVER